ncbi:Ser/Thr and Tyr protein phosphatase (dual specificity) [Enhygromyxa salina]|uniref:Ser/Thr and Tyr protein phosphatase (Dual specificity) n=1 Tax=Enhygromyxa salina TaxID=215803 RepID=A0A0C1ZWU2_9BACT|nr:tyrosine-protein phosphatase [Enhygromyxa salina]KIG15523.1 Ser/Thr and Tyr protein phosphatase (dual specificity) [Enhygromyxa salina]
MRRGLGIMFVGGGLGAGAMGVAVGPVGMVALGWLGLSLIAVGWAYLGHDTRVFGKRSDGTRHVAATLVLLPYLGLLGVVWRLARVTSREPAVTRLSEELWLARRLLAGELPAEVRTIVDLTCEQVEPTVIRQRPGYVCFPILDAAAPRLADLQAAVDQVATAERVLIHCAQGHGRTGLFAAALLLRRGLAGTPQQALAQITAARPGVRLSSVQMRVLDAYADALVVREAAATESAC